MWPATLTGSAADFKRLWIWVRIPGWPPRRYDRDGNCAGLLNRGLGDELSVGSNPTTSAILLNTDMIKFRMAEAYRHGEMDDLVYYGELNPGMPTDPKAVEQIFEVAKEVCKKHEWLKQDSSGSGNYDNDVEEWSNSNAAVPGMVSDEVELFWISAGEEGQFITAYDMDRHKGAVDMYGCPIEEQPDTGRNHVYEPGPIEEYESEPEFGQTVQEALKDMIARAGGDEALDILAI